MKFSVAVWSWLAQLCLHARPSKAGRIEFRSEGGVNTFDIDHSGENSTTFESYCEKKQPKKEVGERCQRPGEYHNTPVLCSGCGWLWSDMHDKCDIPCCDPTMTDHLDGEGKCKCTPYLETYDYSSHHIHHWGGTPDKCCGQNVGDGVHTKPNVLPGKKCGCTDVGVKSHWGASDSDCCSGRRDSDLKCIPGKCAKKGEEGHCCRAAHETDPRSKKSDCPCFHAGDALNPNDIVDFTNCCSGKSDPRNITCGCIESVIDTLPAGATARDCCSGKLHDDRHCKAAECSVVGAAVKGGNHCCSGKEEPGTRVCQCLASGTAIPDNATALDCCSLRLNGKKCAFLKAGEPTPDGSTADVCLSGKIHFGSQDPAAIAPHHHSHMPHGKCSCIPAGENVTEGNETQCCSGAADGGTCTCVAIDEPLQNGGKPRSCCSGAASPSGICRCAQPGAPLPEKKVGGVDACCTRTASGDGKHCGCFDQSSYLHGMEDGQHCCGGVFSFDEGGNQCLCLQKGYAIGSWATKFACCSNETDTDNVCK